MLLTDAVIPGQSFGYNFDDIGNRVWSEQGMPMMHYTYTSNNVNQYTQMTVPGYIPINGKAAADAKVTVLKGSDGSIIAPTRNGEYFSTTMTVDNSTAAVNENLTISAVKYDAAQDKDIVDSQNRSVTVNQTPQSFTYDDDGNMLTNGVWSYAWNGENRMIEALKANNTKLEFKYDYKGRRVEKKVYTYSPSTSNFELSTYKKFVYDGFVQIAEYDAMTTDTLKKSYLRDLNETLLSVNDNGTRYYFNIDGNKNVRSLIDASGNVVAEYDYGPFGRTVGTGGLYASLNPFRFSSEYYDDETSLVYYNFRYYSPELGRWLSRDPINEKGGFNLYGMVDNNVIDWIDFLGYLSNCPTKGFLPGTSYPLVSADHWYEAPIVAFHNTVMSLYALSDTMRQSLGYGINYVEEKTGISAVEVGVTVDTSLPPTIWGDNIIFGSINYLKNSSKQSVFSVGQKLLNNLKKLKPACPIKTNAIKCPIKKPGIGLSEVDKVRIQNFADRYNVEVNVVGSRASNTAHNYSDYDYIVTGANSKLRKKAEQLLPKGKGGGAINTNTGKEKGIDFMNSIVEKDKPCITFSPKKK